MQRPTGPQQFAPPPLPPAVRNLLIGLFAMLVVELILKNIGVVLWDSVAWRPLRAGFAVEQLPLHYLSQSPTRGGISSTLFGMLVIYFFLPNAVADLGAKAVRDAVISAAAGGIIIGMLADAAGLVGGAAWGWTGLVTSLVVLFGLSRPNGIVLLFFVIPAPGWLFVWGTLVIEVLMFMADRSLDTTETLGVWAGTFAWWHLLGPGGRRRSLIKKSKTIEKELSHLRVIDGGRSGNEDDELIH